MRRPGVVAIALVLWAASCGSTVAYTGHGRRGSPDQGLGGLDQSQVATGSSTGATGAGGPSGNGSGSLVSPSVSGMSGQSDRSGGTGRGGGAKGSPGSSAISGMGFDAAHVYLGVPTENDLNTAAHSLGLKGVDTGSVNADIAAIVNYVNTHGGILGRGLVALTYDNPTVNFETNGENQAQADCTYFTQDHQVAAVISTAATDLLNGPTFETCLARHQVPFFLGNNNLVDQQLEDQ